MGILVSCPQGHRLNLKAELAGLRGVCPRCGTAFDIPNMESESQRSVNYRAGESQQATTQREEATPQDARPAREASRAPVPASGGKKTQGAEVPAPPVAVGSAEGDALAERPGGFWYVRPTGGGEYGPADSEMMRQWLEADRIAADSELQRDDWPAGRRARDVFPERFGETTTASTEGTAAEKKLEIRDTAPRPAEIRAARVKSRRRRMLMMLIVSVAGLVPVLIYVLLNQ